MGRSQLFQPQEGVGLYAIVLNSGLQDIRYDKRRYKRRNRIEIMFGRLKDWRRVATRYDRCPTVFLSAIALAATVLFWL
ncbi:transposase [Brevundimonas vesicularis]|uniref:Transposase n=1 Tax=Brevundimonas vesicularis TaxID=41276 RepID=A0A7W9FVN0_BREVE|nr:transposase [Brevundimonas vesicularis]